MEARQRQAEPLAEHPLGGRGGGLCCSGSGGGTHDFLDGSMDEFSSWRAGPIAA
jgi:hypothetical protein